MTRQCDMQGSALIELYFYGELDPAERARFEQHLSACAACRAALDELRTIQRALATRPDISAPPAGDWSGFMSRLDRKLADERQANAAAGVVVFGRPTAPSHGRVVAYLAMAALLALVTMSVYSVMRWRATAPEDATIVRAVRPSIAAPVRPGQGIPQGEGEAASPIAALAASSEQHFERSKLVLLGLTSKDAESAPPEEWTYERELASNLLSDTRLYRMAAEERGMNSLAGVLRDLEVVLLQASFADSDRAALGQLQSLIRKRNLLQKMEVMTSSGI